MKSVLGCPGEHLKPFDSRGSFVLETERSDVRGLAVRGAGLTVLAQAMAFVVQMAAIVVLARLLTPADFGVVTMVTTFSLLLTSFGLNGFTEAVIQRNEINHCLASNLFWINVGSGILLTASFAGAGSVLARLYHDPRVANVTIGISASILFTSVSVLHLALLKRAMLFSVVSLIDIVARAVSVIVSIILGLAGWGYWALVAGAVAQPLAISTGAWLLCRWIPGFPRRVPGTAALVRFAMNIYLHFIVTYAGWNTDNLLVGWRFQAAALGFYKKAFDLFFLPASQLLSPVGAVAMSALSKFNRDFVQFRRHFLGLFSIFAFLGMAVGADLTLVGKDFILLLLGPRWEESGRIFTFFGPGIGIMLLYGMHGWIHVSIGKPERWFRWGIVELSVTVLLFVFCLRWGPVGIATAWSASFWILFLPAFWYAGKPIGLGIGATVAVVWRYLIASLIAGGATAAIAGRALFLTALSGGVGAASRIAIVSLLFGTLYIALVVLLHRGLAPLHQVARLSRDVLPQSWFSRRLPRVATVFESQSALEPAGPAELSTGALPEL